MPPRREQPTFQWNFYLLWVLTSTMGWLVGGAFQVELLAGPAIALLQWLVLRPYVPNASRWIVTGIIGWLVGWSIVLVLPPELQILSPAIIGLATSIAQWFVLRDWVHQAGWWLVICTLAWYLGLIGLMGPAFTGAVLGLVSGIGMELLLRYQKDVSR